MIPTNKMIFKNAPRILLGAFFLLSSCEEETGAIPPPESGIPPKEAIAKPSKEIPSNPEDSSGTTKAEAETAAIVPTGPVRFMAYNLKNYLTMDVYRKGGVKERRPKQESEVDAVVDIIVKENPQIVGVSEIGTKEDLADLQARLKKAGLDLPHSHHAGGMDTVRHLGILSALPISGSNSQDQLVFKINDDDFLMRRGILDVTIALPNGPTHFIGLHLKSKRASNSFDESQVRLNEARLARKHCDDLFTEDPEARIVMYGDMNDTRKSPPLAMMMGRRNSQNYLEDAFIRDSRGHLWTHYWDYQQQYSRFDYILLSKVVKAEVDWKKSYVSDRANWFEASDHRPVIVTFGE